jgi:D-serine deaminase-like pyridoxal phosphate-dependent protein
MLRESSPQPATRATPNGAASTASYPTRDYAYYRAIFRNQRAPYAFVDLDALEENIQYTLARANGKSVRLATKSLRSVAIIKRILGSNSQFQGLMCFTAREAVHLANQGFSDLLVGYPCYDERDIAEVAQTVASGASITLMVDSIAHVERVSAAAERAGTQIPLCLDIDMSLPVPGLHFGVWRSPLHTAEDARPVIERIQSAPGVFMDGVMGYEAQIAGVGDNMPGKAAKNAVVRLLKRRSAPDVARRRGEVVALARDLGADLRFVNGGGTGSMRTTGAEAAVTEITVGSGFFGPSLFDNYQEFHYQPAAAYGIEIVRRPAPGIYTCLGGGYIASGATGPEKAPAIYLPSGARYDPNEGAGEVQTPIHYAGPERLTLGDPIFLRHSKAGELCEHFNQLALVSTGVIVETVSTYRGDGLCFL